MTMTDKLDTKAIRAQMDALAGFTAGPWNADLGETTYRIKADGMNIATANFVTLLDRIPTDQVGQNVRLIAVAPDIHATILALCDALDELRAESDRLQKAIIRQAGAAKTLRECTLTEVQHLKDMDRSEYHAAASLDSERNANNVLTDENDKLRADNERLRNFIADFSETKFDRIDRRASDPQDDLDPLTDYLAIEAWQEDARAALAQEGGQP